MVKVEVVPVQGLCVRGRGRCEEEQLAGATNQSNYLDGKLGSRKTTSWLDLGSGVSPLMYSSRNP